MGIGKSQVFAQKRYAPRTRELSALRSRSARGSSPESFGAYDAAGNMTVDGSATYFYDAENRLIATAGTSYIYDGDGNRVEKCTEGTTPGTCSSVATGTMYWRGTSPDPQAETDLSGNVLENYIFFNGQRIARREPTKTVHFYFSDHLGSHGVVVNSTGTTFEQDIDYFPYGGQENDYSPNVAQHYKFTGKERDSESGNDYFGFRYYASTMGRFLTPDPAGMMAVDIGSPQTLNRYAYVVNNPLSFIDPFGLDCVYLNSGGTGVEKGGVDQNSSSGECGQTGGYWVEGAVTNVTIGGDAETVSLAGTTNGTDNNTSASYQQNTTITVGEYYNNNGNIADHLAFGIQNGPQWGLNPRSDAQFFKYKPTHPFGGRGVPGLVKQQVGGTLDRVARIPATGMQAQMIQNGINQGIQNPPNYDIFGGGRTCDCASWAQQVLGDAGINTGPPTQVPNILENQIQNLYPQQQ